MPEKKEVLDLGGPLNVKDLSRTFDNSVFILKDFSIRKNEKSERIKGHLKIGIAGMTLKDALADLGSALVISWAQKVRSNGEWNLTPPMEGETVQFQALDFFAKKEKKEKGESMESLVGRVGLTEAVRLLTMQAEAAAERVANSKKDSEAKHATPDEIRARNEEEALERGEKKV